MGEWYDKTGKPVNNTIGAASEVRAEFTLVEAALAKLPTLTGKAIKLIRVNSDGDALESYDTYESLTAGRVLTQSDSHKIFGLNDADGFTVTLPRISVAGVGWRAVFRLETVTTDVYNITEHTAHDTNIIIGGIIEREKDTGQDDPYTNGFTQAQFSLNAVLGDYIEIESNGTNYYLTGVTNSHSAITLS